MDASFSMHLAPSASTIPEDWQSFQDTNRGHDDAQAAMLPKQMSRARFTDARLLPVSGMRAEVAPTNVHNEEVSTSQTMERDAEEFHDSDEFDEYGVPTSHQVLSETCFQGPSDHASLFHSPSALPQELMESHTFPPIDFGTASQIGRLKYAITRKEQARAWFKENTKRKQMARGEAEKFMRRRRGDHSMNGLQLKKRRLRMNQDSAAASRYARDEYIQTLEAMIQSAEKDLAHVVNENRKLHHDNRNLTKLAARLKDQVEAGSRPDMDNLWEALSSNKKVDTVALSKLLDLVTNPEDVSARANGFEVGNVGIKPAPAV